MELPHQLLAEPDVNLSTHTAPIRPTLEFCFTRRILPFRVVRQFNGLTQPLCSIPITGTSSLLRAAPPQCLASVLSSLWVCHLDFSLSIKATGSPISLQKPRLSSRHLNAGYRLSRNQVSDKLV